jgi:pilus assembly protein CpaB
VSPRSALVVMLSLVFGGSAAVGVRKYVANGPGSGAPRVETVPVVVAVEDIPRGASIAPGLVRVREVPAGVMPPGTLAKVEDAVERAVFVPLLKDEPILDAKLAPKGARRGMAALVPNGLRAFTINTPSVASGVAGFILPGNKVDVLLTMDNKGDSTTTTLLQNLEILAVDQRIDAPADNRIDPNQLRSVTLLVTPDQAARLDLAQNKGSLHLSLRNHKDDLHAETAPVHLSEFDPAPRPEPPMIAAVTPAPPAAPAPLPRRYVAIYRGNRPVERFRVGEGPARAGGAETPEGDPDRPDGSSTR